MVSIEPSHAKWVSYSYAKPKHRLARLDRQRPEPLPRAGVYQRHPYSCIGHPGQSGSRDERNRAAPELSHTNTRSHSGSLAYAARVSPRTAAASNGMMQFKIDENLPVECVQRLQAAAMQPKRLLRKGWRVNRCGRFCLLQHEQRVLVTLDRGLAIFGGIPIGSHAGIIVLRLRVRIGRCVWALVEQLLPLLRGTGVGRVYLDSGVGSCASAVGTGRLSLCCRPSCGWVAGGQREGVAGGVADGGGEGGGSSRTEYLYDGQCRCVSRSLWGLLCAPRG
jgi:hypothetical protein